MPTPTYTPLATVTLGTAAASVTFSSIPATYRDLIFVFNGTTTIDDGVGLRFNGDTGSNYSNVRMFGNSSGAGSDTSTTTRIPTTAGNSSLRTAFISQVMDYSATDKHKTVLTRNNITDNNVAAIAGRWANTAAITSVTVLSPGSTITSGSTISLYAIVS
jgi:hypothetical protein